MKKHLQHYVAKLQRFFQRKKVVEKSLEPKRLKILIGIIKETENSKLTVFDFRIKEDNKMSLHDHLQRYHECADSLLKEQYLIDMYNDGFLDEAIKIYENRNGVIVFDNQV